MSAVKTFQQGTLCVNSPETETRAVRHSHHDPRGKHVKQGFVPLDASLLGACDTSEMSFSCPAAHLLSEFTHPPVLAPEWLLPVSGMLAMFAHKGKPERVTGSSQSAWDTVVGHAQPTKASHEHASPARC